MLVNKLYINLIIRIILITIISLVFAFAFVSLNDMLININLIFLIIIQMLLLIRKMNLVNYELTNFFNSIEYEDSSLIIHERRNWKSHRKLIEAIKRINNKIREIKRHDAASEAYFQIMVEHIDVGILSLDENCNIDINNSAMKRLLGLREEITTTIFKNRFAELYELFINMPVGEKEIFTISRNGSHLNLFIHATSISLLGRKLKLISMQDIKSELDDRELDTWQKMIRVLTHEIMNSISPVSSTIKTIKEFLTEKDNKTALKPEDISGEILKDTVKGLKIIDDRSTGLTDFVQKFRSLTLLPKPDMEILNVSNVVEELGILMKSILEENGIDYKVDKGAANIQITADKKLVHQALINLINNSVDALSSVDKPQIQVKVKKDDLNVNIEISDNGEGIPPDRIDDIFTPFFTTREKGSGIGLSISKQIMRMHGGDIIVYSVPGKQTSISLQFRTIA